MATAQPSTAPTAQQSVPETPAGDADTQPDTTPVPPPQDAHINTTSSATSRPESGASTVTSAVAGVAAAAASAGLNVPPHVRFWREHNREFSTWFLLLSEEQRRAVVVEAGGRAMPERGPGQGGRMGPTDILLPELTIAGMLAGGGRCLVLFFTRRAVEACRETDTKMLQTLHDKGILPKFSGGRLDHLKIAAIDPMTEDVVGLPEGCTTQQLDAVKAQIATGKLVQAEVYLARKLREEAIASFLDSVIAIFHREAGKASGRS
eukprot:m.15433 g.15433  ORF g.15433 m.15433 type:complete len:263 (-) comp3264_c0_seq2:68-856(-)